MKSPIPTCQACPHCAHPLLRTCAEASPAALLDAERALLPTGIELHVNRGEYLFRQRQEADFLFVLRGGALELADAGSPPRVVNRPTDVVGLEELLLDRPHPCDGRVLEHTVVLAFDKAQVRHLFARDAQARRYLLHKLCDGLSQREAGVA